MILDKFNMVSMGGIDIVESQGIAVAGLYQRLVESIALCRYSTLYNWKFAGINIPPTPVELVHENGVVSINEAISVDSDDIVHIQSFEPVLEALLVSENGFYLPSEGYAGFSQVDVEIPLETKEITGNGFYLPSEGYAGFSQVDVEIPLITKIITENGIYNASDDSADGYSSVTVNVSGGEEGIVLQPDIWFKQSDITSSGWTDSIGGTAMTLGGDYILSEGESLAITGNSGCYFSIPGSELMIRMKCKVNSDFTPANSVFWYRASCLFGRELSGTQKDFAICINSRGMLSIGYAESSVQASNINIVDGLEHDILCIARNGSISLFCDGVLVAYITRTWSGSSISQLGVMWQRENQSTSVKGEVYEIAVKSLV